ncbi:hypothetical protein BT96DRAFT_1001916 [Gymnopus androsaceus JB14]|uniref:Uncharacterized protein n=1 Tax=Gymnopus androsaceus JB14 TaxID=1447944 RepID=A0A6A4H0C3_9AGAR|nr:hypothetical protein BT96DRAFT_1001916 [Gymnopus androsaceus JB14]
MNKENLLKNRKKCEDGQSLSMFTLPSGLAELPDSILKLYSFLSELSFSDGVCGTFLPHTKEYITSPNCKYIPSPPMGLTQDLYCQSNACYSDNNCVCWPQPFNVNYPWYSAITRNPTNFTSLADNIMWLDLWDSDLTYTIEGEKHKEGVVKKELTDELEPQIAPLKRRTLAWHQTNQDELKLRFIEEHTDTINLCLTCLKTVAALIRVQQLALIKLQCGLLSVQALLDYTDLESHSITSDACLSFKGNKMGGFVWNSDGHESGSRYLWPQKADL